MNFIAILAVIFTFGVAILAHEFGHFLFAKLMGVGVETFSIGMGRKLVKIKKGETTYCISAIPFGGYVVLKGSLSKELEDHIEEESRKKREKKEGETEKEENQEPPPKKSLPELVSDDIVMLRNKPLPVKIVIYAAGVFMNYILAIVTFTIIMMVGMDLPAPKEPVTGYIAPGSVPAKLGIESGDRVLLVNGQSVEHFRDIYDRMETLMKEKVTTLTLTMNRSDTRYTVDVPLSQGSREFRGFLQNFAPPYAPYIEDVIYNRPAEKAGIRGGDYITAIDGQPINDWMELVEIIGNSAGEPLRVRIRRGEEYLETTVTPQLPHDGTKRAQIGIAPGEPNTIRKKWPPGEAVLEAVNTSWRIMSFIAVNTGKMFARFNVKEMGDNMGGPVAIAIESYRQAKSGPRNYFYFFGAFNIMLLMLNILPLPILDGGHILFSVIESIFKRPISPKVLIRIYTVMLILLIGIALLVTYNDIIQNLWRLGVGQ